MGATRGKENFLSLPYPVEYEPMMLNWVIDQACSVNVTGNWLSSLLRLDRGGVEVHWLTHKKRGQNPAISTVQAWLLKDLFYMAFGECFLAGQNG